MQERLLLLKFVIAQKAKKRAFAETPSAFLRTVVGRARNDRAGQMVPCLQIGRG
jgi:hypothetical protein